MWMILMFENFDSNDESDEDESRKKKLLILQLAIGVRHLRWVLKFAKYQIFINVTYFINNKYYERI